MRNNAKATKKIIVESEKRLAQKFHFLEVKKKKTRLAQKRNMKSGWKVYLLVPFLVETLLCTHLNNTVLR